MASLPASPLVRQIVEAALAEDLGRGDVTTTAFVDPGKRAAGAFIAQQAFIWCGGPLLPIIFQIQDPSVSVSVSMADGQAVQPGTILAEAEGAAGSLLAAERVSLNFLQRLSGIATTTNRFVQAIRGTSSRILDTRKTTPGLRVLEKYAVRVGGGQNHRAGLDDGILVKENHIQAAGGLPQVIRRLGNISRGLLRVEIEVENLDQLKQLVDHPVDVIMLDNMSPADVAEAVRIAAGRFKLEASGGITLDNVLEYAETGVDYISVGALTHSCQSVDISFLLRN
ncbi:MAG TPA: carboxylating nicotinate-nucleotide diphosphorylase [Acidobacteriota bacterium]|jgi:nicotinate-nucleotide pyrophosphorylase (carboxylating)